MTEISLAEIAYNSPAYQEAVVLRHEILRAPLGLEFPTGELESEGAHYHLAAYEGEQLAGCLVLVPLSGGAIKMRQVAVANHFQRRGVGRALVQFAETCARERGFTLMTLHARETAAPFYENLGYQTLGAPFEEVSLPHRKMQKRL